MTVVKIIVFVVILAVGLVFFTLQRNGANLFQEPGFAKRLSTYLTSHVAETSDNPAFPELRTPVFSVSAEKLYQRVLYVAAESGWSILASDSDNLNANFVVRTPVFLFEDDVFVQVQFVSMNESSLYIRSISRTGIADFAANAGHIQDLINGIKK
jgi:hypothetical protein